MSDAPAVAARRLREYARDTVAVAAFSLGVSLAAAGAVWIVLTVLS